MEANDDNLSEWNVDGPSAVSGASSHGFAGFHDPDSHRPENDLQHRNNGSSAGRGGGADGGSAAVVAVDDRPRSAAFVGDVALGMGAWPDRGDGIEEPWPEAPVTLTRCYTPAMQNKPHPELSLPTPELNLDFRMAVSLNPRVNVGVTPLGQRNWISFTGGSWSASFGSGTVLPGGQDSQIIVPNGSARIETTYLLQTNDSPAAYIVVKTEGWRTGDPKVLEALSDPARADSVDPTSYSFRLFIRLETGDERYADKINYGLWVGSGMRKDREVIYDAYRIS